MQIVPNRLDQTDKYEIMFSWKNKKNTNLSSTEIAQSVLMVNKEY